MRITSIDYIKFLCIGLMVLCHYGLRGDVAVKLIYGFHMPMLFMVSGCLYKKREIRDELKVFLIPIAFYSLLGIVSSMFFEVVIYHNESLTVFLQRTVPGFFTANHGLYHTPFTGIWFIIGLLCTRLIFSLLPIDKYGLITSLVCVIITIFNNSFGHISGINNIYVLKPLQIIPFFYIGYVIRRERYLFVYQSVKYNRLISVLVIAAYTAICLWNGRIEMYYGDFGKNYLIVIINVTMLFFALSSLFNLSSKKIVEAYSIGTFLILGTHSILFPSLVSHINQYVCSWNISVLVCSTLFFAAIFPVIIFMNNHCPILLGKMSKK